MRVNRQPDRPDRPLLGAHVHHLRRPHGDQRRRDALVVGIPRRTLLVRVRLGRHSRGLVPVGQGELRGRPGVGLAEHGRGLEIGYARVLGLFAVSDA